MQLNVGLNSSNRSNFWLLSLINLPHSWIFLEKSIALLLFKYTLHWLREIDNLVMKANWIWKKFWMFLSKQKWKKTMLSLNSGGRYTRCRGLGMYDCSWEAHRQRCEALLVFQLTFMFSVFWNIPWRFCNEYPTTFSWLTLLRSSNIL